ncbi:MAG: TIGR03067 domain-containing protein [Gemmataceae bacterium]|nr:TIGR03067 domain-containing protein [Gemmataceae bacterium]
MRQRALAVAVVVLAVEILSAQGGDAVKADKEKLKGTWVLERAEFMGKSMRPEEPMKLTFQGDKVINQEGDRKPKELTYSINPTKKPKEMDVKHPRNGKGEVVIRVIYEIEGDTLKVGSLPPEKEKDGKSESIRPTSFEKCVVLIYKRAKS